MDGVKALPLAAEPRKMRESNVLVKKKRTRKERYLSHGKIKQMTQVSHNHHLIPQCLAAWISETCITCPLKAPLRATRHYTWMERRFYSTSLSAYPSLRLCLGEQRSWTLTPLKSQVNNLLPKNRAPHLVIWNLWCFFFKEMTCPVSLSSLGKLWCTLNIHLQIARYATS